MKAVKLIITGLAIAISSGSIYAQKTFAQVTRESEAELRAAVKELADLRNQIADEKIPISRRLTELESEVQIQRGEYDRTVRAAENREVGLSALQDRVEDSRAQNIYLKNLMSTYIQQFSTRIDVSELQTYKASIDEAEQIIDRANATDAEKMATQIKVIEASLDRLKTIIGGHRFRGNALGSNDREISGDYVLVGPFSFFSDGAENVGFSEGQANRVLPSIVNVGVDEKFINAINEVATTGSGSLPIDTTEGDAFKLGTLKKSMLDEIKAGGTTMVPLLLIAAIAFLIAIFKLFDINSVKSPKAGALQQILDNLNSGNKQQALEIANSVDGPFGDLLVEAVEHSDQEKELLEEVLYERLLAAQPKLERFIAFIALTAGAAPLLGLLGTVTGMIKTFALITVFGTGDAQTLSSGISEALITTQYGLYVAIPSLLAQALLTRLAKGKLGEMEQTAVAFVNGLANRK